MKKFLAMLLAAMMVLSMAACGEPQEKPSEEDKPSEKQTVTGMSYSEFMEAEIGTKCTVVAYVQAHQSWWDGKVAIYAADDSCNGFFFYETVCTEEDAKKLTPGTKIVVTGDKAEWKGEVEIQGGTFEFADDGESFVVEKGSDVTEYLGTDEMIDFMNQLVRFEGLTVVASKAQGSEEEVAFLYDWNGSGEEGSDLYFNVTNGTDTFSFAVESYLCGADSDVYKAVKELKIGDKVNLEGFAYWYDGLNPHITSCEVVD